MTRRLVNALDSEAVQKIATVFEGIRAAAAILEAVNPTAILKAWDEQMEILPYIDPTQFQQIMANRADMDRKRAIIAAADAFVREWNRIKAEALAAETKDASSTI